jgi:[acyl-carrier-protein] S-malonyltransferase
MSMRTGGAFHTTAYVSVVDQWSAAVADVAIEAPKTCFVSSVTGERVESPDAIRRCLVEQLVGPVLWRRAARAVQAAGCDCLVEASEVPSVARLIQLTLGRGVRICRVQTASRPTSSAPGGAGAA